VAHPNTPPAQGLYDPGHEHDACGVGFIAHIKGTKSHSIVQNGLEILENLTHRGATGYDPLLGDGAGILLQIPDDFLRGECRRNGISLPAPGEYGVGMVFLPKDPDARAGIEALLDQYVKAEGQTLLGWRDVPVDNSRLSEATIEVEPVIRQVFIGRGGNCADDNAFERKLFVIRKQVEHAVKAQDSIDGKQFYIPSMSARTIVYKGMLLAEQVGEYFLDLANKKLVSALALVHQRFSTNTFPSWRIRSG
jgi:glutamate synthase (NADPH/NADH) large chain